MLKEHEKFWAFIALIFSVVLLAVVSTYMRSSFQDGQHADPTVLQAKLSILNIAIGGLVAVLGAAAQALFRISSTDQQNATNLKNALDKVPPVTGEAAESEAHHQPESGTAPADDLPPMLR